MSHADELIALGSLLALGAAVWLFELIKNGRLERFIAPYRQALGRISMQPRRELPDTAISDPYSLWVEVLAGLGGALLLTASFINGSAAARGWGAVLLAFGVVFGGLNFSRGRKLERAIAPYRDALIAAKARLDGRDDDPAERDIWLNQMKIADIFWRAGHRVTRAVPLLRQCMPIAEKRAAANPADPERQRDLVLTYARIARDVSMEACVDEATVAEAAAWWRKVTDIIGRLDGAFPDIDWQLEHVISLSGCMPALIKKAGIRQPKAFRVDAEAALSRALTVMRRLEQQDKLTIAEKQRIVWIMGALSQVRR